MTTNGNMPTINWPISNAWRAAADAEALALAVRIGEQITDLLDESIGALQQAQWDVDMIITGAYRRCQELVNRLSSEVHRLAPVLARLRAASKAVTS